MFSARRPGSAAAVEKYLAEIGPFDTSEPEPRIAVTSKLKGQEGAEVARGTLVDASIQRFAGEYCARVSLLSNTGESYTAPLFFVPEIGPQGYISMRKVAAQGIYHFLSGPDWKASQDFEARVAACNASLPADFVGATDPLL